MFGVYILEEGVVEVYLIGNKVLVNFVGYLSIDKESDNEKLLFGEEDSYRNVVESEK